MERYDSYQVEFYPDASEEIPKDLPPEEGTKGQDDCLC
jgi:hypothetical protein